MKTKLITAILTLITFVSFSFIGQADNPPKQDQSKAINSQTVNRPRIEISQNAFWNNLFVVYILDGCGQVIDVYITSIDNLPNRTDVPGNDVVVYPFSFTIDQTPINP